jgi:hypothetical protein
MILLLSLSKPLDASPVSNHSANAARAAEAMTCNRVRGSEMNSSPFYKRHSVRVKHKIAVRRD